MRTTIDHVRKAAKQLSRFRELAQDDGFMSEVAGRAGLDGRVVSCVTCIVTANRMLSGAVIDGHPVRGIFELASFIRSETVTINGHKVGVRPSGKVTGDTLRSYIADDFVHRHLLRAMIPYSKTFKYGRHAVTKHSFVLDQQALVKILAGALNAPCLVE